MYITKKSRQTTCLLKRQINNPFEIRNFTVEMSKVSFLEGIVFYKYVKVIKVILLMGGFIT